MDINECKKRQDQLMDTLYKMSEKIYPIYEIQLVSDVFYELYADGVFRHSYSAFLPFIMEINKDGNKYSIDYLSHNLESLKDFAVDNDEILGISDSLYKLCDHLNLEIARLSTFYNDDGKVKDLKAQIRSMEKTLRLAEKQLSDATSKAKNLQTEIVAVLSIFSAIVIAFFGGMNFITSAMAGMQGTHVFKALLICLVCGVVLVNTIFLLLYFAGKLMERNIYAKCVTENCTCKNQIEPKCSSLVRLKKRLPYVFWVNGLLIFMIVADILAWIINFYLGGGCMY